MCFARRSEIVGVCATELIDYYIGEEGSLGERRFAWLRSSLMYGTVHPA